MGPGLFLLASGLSLAVKGAIQWHQERNWVLDLLDSFVIADVVANIRNPEATAKDSRGVNFVDAIPTKFAEGERDNFVSMVEGMHPSYRAMMDDSQPIVAGFSHSLYPFRSSWLLVSWFPSVIRFCNSGLRVAVILETSACCSAGSGSAEVAAQRVGALAKFWIMIAHPTNLRP